MRFRHAAAESWLDRYALMPRERAAQRVRFFDQYRMTPLTSR
jgi:hypothetical protein